MVVERLGVTFVTLTGESYFTEWERVACHA